MQRTFQTLRDVDLYTSDNFAQIIYKFYNAYKNASENVRENIDIVYNNGVSMIDLNSSEDDISNIVYNLNKSELEKIQELKNLFISTSSQLRVDYFPLYNSIIEMSVYIQDNNFSMEFIDDVSKKAELYILEGGNKKQKNKLIKRKSQKRKSQQRKKSPKRKSKQSNKNKK